MDLALPTTTSSNPLVPTESLGQNSTSSNEEPPSSFPRAPQTATTEDVEPAPPSPDPSNKKKRPKARDNGGSLPEDPADQLAIAHANLAAAPIVGVVGYGPGTGGGSGIRRHTPSCDFCKRRKERCVGGPPCQTCANRGLECTFDMVNKSHFDRKRAKKPSTNDLGAPIVPLVPPKPAKPAEKAPRTFAKRDNVSEVACMFCRERRKKCSAEKPTCLNCHRRGVECVYSDQPRARKGGRKRKDGMASNNQADGGGEGTSTSGAARNGTGSNPTGTMPLPGMLMPMPFLSPLPCHFCRSQDLPCDRNFPGCSHCHRRAQPCTYDPFTPDISQVGIWPAAMSLPGGSMPFTTMPGAQVTNPSAAAQQAAMAAALPYFNVAWLAQLAALHQTGNVNPTSMNPMAAMLTVPVSPAVANAPGAVGGSGNPGASSSTMTHPPMVFPPGYDPAAAAAAFAQAQTAAQVAAVAQSEPVVERSNVPAHDGAGALAHQGERNAIGTSPEQQPEDADGEDDDDLDLDDLDDLQGGEKPT